MAEGLAYLILLNPVVVLGLFVFGGLRKPGGERLVYCVVPYLSYSFLVCALLASMSPPRVFLFYAFCLPSFVFFLLLVRGAPVFRIGLISLMSMSVFCVSTYFFLIQSDEYSGSPSLLNKVSGVRMAQQKALLVRELEGLVKGREFDMAPCFLVHSEEVDKFGGRFCVDEFGVCRVRLAEGSLWHSWFTGVNACPVRNFSIWFSGGKFENLKEKLSWRLSFVPKCFSQNADNAVEK